MRYALWIVQGLLALLFLFGGVVKFVTPYEEMMAQMPLALPAWFIYFIGAAEVLGALGLVLPAITHIRPGLVPLAAAGLTIIMIGAVGYSLVGGQGVMAIFPLVVGLFTAFVAYGRWRLLPHRGGATRRPALQPAR
jgi:hypothetical protein